MDEYRRRCCTRMRYNTAEVCALRGSLARIREACLDETVDWETVLETVLEECSDRGV